MATLPSGHTRPPFVLPQLHRPLLCCICRLTTLYLLVSYSYDHRHLSRPGEWQPPWEPAWRRVLSIDVPSHEMPSDQINLPILGSGDAETLAHGNVLYHPFANKEGEAQRHGVTDGRDEARKRKSGL